LKDIRLDVAWEYAHQFSRGSFDLVIRNLDNLRRAAIEAKNWDLDALARMSADVRTARIASLIAQAGRHLAEGTEVIYSFSRFPQTASGQAVLFEIQMALRSAGVSRIAIGVREFLVHLGEVLAI